MKKAIIILLFSPLFCLGQVSVDSLLNIWNNTSNSDKARLEALHIVSSELYLLNNPDSAFRFAEKEYEFAKEIGDKYAIALSLKTQAKAKSYLSEYEESLELFLRSSKIFEEYKDSTQIADILNSIGTIYKIQGFYEKAISEFNRSILIGDQASKGLAFYNIATIYRMKGEYDLAHIFFQKSLTISMKESDIVSISNTILGIGNMLLDIGDYNAALKYYVISLKINKEIGNNYALSKVINNIGSLYSSIKEIDKAILFYKQSMYIKQKIGDYRGIATSIHNIGSVYYNIKDYERALNYYLHSLKLFQKFNDKRNCGIISRDIGLIYFVLKNYTKAYSYFSRSYTLLEEVDDKYYLSAVMNNLGSYYITVGNYPEALSYSLKALECAVETDIYTNIKNAAENLYIINKEKGNHKEALKMLEVFKLYKDSINKQKDYDEILKQEYQFKFETQELANKIRFEKQENKRKLQRQKEKSILIGVFITFIFFTLLFIKLRSVKAYNEKQILFKELEALKQQEITINLRENEKKLQLDKHKIENAINTKLNETDWKILNIIYESPGISNKIIADKIYLSIEGTSSSLRKMYKLFPLQAQVKNKKIALVMEAIRISIS